MTTWVLLEGASDVAAVRALRAARGVMPAEEPCHLVTMGGATTIRRHLERAVATSPRPRVIGLCDEQEAPYFVRALGLHATALRLGHQPTERTLPDVGFHVCRRDLEDELMRAHGVRGTLAVLDALELGATFEAFTRQLAWADRPVEDQLRRFVGTTSGRKELVAGALAAALDEAHCPAPLAGLLASMAVRSVQEDASAE